MATQTSPRRASWTGIGIGVLIAAALGVGIPYGVINFMSESSKPNAGPAAPAASAPLPPKIEFLGAATVNGTTAALTSDPKQTTELGEDDAMIIWLKVTSANGQGGGQRNGPAPVAAGGGGGGGGRGRRMRLPLVVKDEAGRVYAATPERKENGFVALHLKKGYDTKPALLTIEEVVQDKVIDKWEVKDVPAPKIVLPDDALKGPAPGEIQLHEGQTKGQVVPTIHLSMPLAKNQGVFLVPVAASYTTVDGTRPGMTVVTKAGENPYDGPLNIPNAAMARRVAFDATTYDGVVTTETVTFHTAQIVSRFGQPTFIVDKDEVVTTPSGLKVKLIKQDRGLRRAPRHFKPEVNAEVNVDVSSLANATAGGIAPRIVGQFVDPPLAEYGLSKINLTFIPSPVPQGVTVFDLTPPAPVTAKPGNFKFGTIPALKLLITVTKPRIGATKRIVLPVNPKVLPPLEGGSGPTGAAR